MCQEWLDDFMNFYNWAMANGYADDLRIDRIDVNGNYEPSNCRWITNAEQQNNKRNNKMIEYKGETKTLAEWCRFLSLNYYTTYSRIFVLGWNAEEAFESPAKTH